MSLHHEVAFEREICDHLGANGWLYEEGSAAAYSRELALYPPDLFAWVQEAQPDAWEVLQKNHGAKAEATLVQRVRQQLDQVGTLDLLRHGVEVLGLPKALKLAEFKPAFGLNPAILARYDANRLRVVRQVRYSTRNENCLDLVLFLNGIPVATAELKTDNTQNIADAVWQYKTDRLPKAAGQAPEPLLSFPSGALVHFAVSNREVQMTTRLEGPRTQFLPFNQGSDPGGPDCGAGNPVMAGHRTAYLWEEVWERHSWLEILGRYCIVERDKKKQIRRLVFPRYHQLAVTRLLLQAVLEEGPGWRYLIQHSAGSGKTASIGWSSHLLADLHDENDRKVFDTVLVVSDRSVIDSQLQETLENFERRKRVVASITTEKGIKSDQLAAALSGDKKIVVCTIQTFPALIKKMQELTATSGKRFAVIADEAHSSQTGDAALKLRKVLSAAELAELADGGEVSIDDLLAADMSTRAGSGGITYVAFTATPKAKTLELFGRRPNPNEPAGPGNLPAPFHVYSMRQAIEEGFILKDTTYVVDFVNDPNDILAAFKTYYATAELAEATDPNLILDLKTKLDAQGHYDEYEIDRVVKVLLDDSRSDKVRQSQLMAAIEPVAQRLMTLHKEARLAYRQAEDINDGDTLKRAKDELDALTLFRSDLGTYGRFYTFLSQIFDYANTGLEKRAMFYKALLPLLEFEREINTVDLSKVVLTHHHLRDLGTRKLDLKQGASPAIPGLAPGGGGVQDKNKVELAEIIAKLNELFSGELGDNDKLPYVCSVIRGKLMESSTLRQQAAANSKKQFSNSPDINKALLDAIIGALDAHQLMSTQALNSEDVRAGMIDILLNHTNLYEDLRDQNRNAMGRCR
jgi:type I site-specific restriction-modification system R (restriction) subunit